MASNEKRKSKVTGPGGGGGGVLSPIWWWGVWPEKKYRGVRELLFIPKKGGVREPVLTAAEGSRGGGGGVREGVSHSRKGGLGGLTQTIFVS